MALTGTRRPRLLLIADLDFAGSKRRWIEGALAAADAIPDDFPALLMLRAKSLGGEERAAAYARAVDRLAPTPVLVNGSTDDAVLAGAAGVHWPEADIPRSLAPTRIGFVRGASVHDLAAARHAGVAGADYLVFGPVHEPGSKSATGVGLEPLRALCAAVERPVLAIGGIAPLRIAGCLEAGAHGVAVVSAAFGADDVAAAVGLLVAAFGNVPGSG